MSPPPRAARNHDGANGVRGAADVQTELWSRYCIHHFMGPMTCRPHMMAWAAVCLTTMRVARGTPVVRDLAAMTEGAEWAGPRPRRSRSRLLKHVMRAAMVDPDYLKNQFLNTLKTVDDALKAGGTDCEGHIFHAGKAVASGQYGAVHLDQRNGARAVKFMFQRKEGVGDIIENFNRECEVMRLAQARARVPKCFAVCDVVHDGKNTQALLMEYIPGAANLISVKGDAKNDKSTYKWEKIGYELYTSLLGMISSDIINNDQKSPNILVDKNSDVVFIDMGKAATRDTWDVYCPRGQAVGLVDNKNNCAENWVDQVVMTVNAVFDSMLKVADCPKARDYGSAPCLKAATQWAEGVMQAFCNDIWWKAFRFHDKKTKRMVRVHDEGEEADAWCDMGCHKPVRRRGLRRDHRVRVLDMAEGEGCPQGHRHDPRGGHEVLRTGWHRGCGCSHSEAAATEDVDVRMNGRGWRPPNYGGVRTTVVVVCAGEERATPPMCMPPPAPSV